MISSIVFAVQGQRHQRHVHHDVDGPAVVLAYCLLKARVVATNRKQVRQVASHVACYGRGWQLAALLRSGRLSLPRHTNYTLRKLCRLDGG